MSDAAAYQHYLPKLSEHTSAYPGPSRDSNYNVAIASAASITYKNCFKLSASSETFPPFSASLIMTCLCNQMFMVAVSFVLPV